MRSVYIIKETMVFFPRSHIISMIDGGSKILLSIPASLCFRVLIENQGCIVSHKELLERVWAERGINVNNNTLYQNIFLLRKALSSINDDVKGIITTVSRRGFLIREDVKIEYQQEYFFSEHKDSFDKYDEFEHEKNDDIESTDNLVKEEIVLSGMSSCKEKKSYPTDTFLINNKVARNNHPIFSKISVDKMFFISLIITLAFFSICLSVPVYNNVFETYKKLETNDQCKILINNINDTNIENLSNILKDIGVSCNRKKYIYVSYNFPFDRISIIACLNDNIYEFKHCYSYYYIK